MLPGRLHGRAGSTIAQAQAHAQSGTRSSCRAVAGPCVRLRLREVSLPQTIRYLHEIEDSAQVLSVKALRIRQRPEKPELLDVTFTVSSFEPL